MERTRVLTPVEAAPASPARANVKAGKIQHLGFEGNPGCLSFRPKSRFRHLHHAARVASDSPAGLEKEGFHGCHGSIIRHKARSFKLCSVSHDVTLAKTVDG